MGVGVCDAPNELPELLELLELLELPLVGVALPNESKKLPNPLVGVGPWADTMPPDNMTKKANKLMAMIFLNMASPFSL
ncbi:MAG: hypothetical protein DCC52_00220 [Chloroflexi bacterium]|nr:MAG: hypothetical protein DCC52_00220 [Chloroflexota bacterium]